MAAAVQLSLLDWAPPSPVVRFDDGAIRSQTLAGRVCKAVAAALRECRHDRPTIAAQMSGFLGATVGVNALNAYASEARLDRLISLPRFMALIEATRDMRLLQMLAEPYGWAVIDRRYLPLIELSLVRERREELARHQRKLQRIVRGGAPA